jgi:hypothetical protein
MEVLTLKLDAAAISQKTCAIHEAILEQSSSIHTPNFTDITDQDVADLFDLYDDAFFDGWLNQRVSKKSSKPITFRVSTRMTRSGGKTTCWHQRKRFGKTKKEYEIAVAGRLLQMSFGDVDRPVLIAGHPCTNRLEALQRIMEHEIIHLAEMLAWDHSSCHKPRFKSIVKNIFNHTAVHHDMVTPREEAAVRHNIRIGSLASFEVHSRIYIGVVNRINHRATILVESSEGERYRNGKTYEKHYVPLDMLTPAIEQRVAAKAAR